MAEESQPPPPPPSVFDLRLAELRAGDPLRWLRLGWRDFLRSRVGLFYGLCFFLMGHALMAVFRAAPAYVLALSAGFLLLGPFLCLGLYHVSRALEEGREPSLPDSLLAWEQTKGSIAIFAGVLLILEMLWGRASLVVFAVTFSTMPDTANLVAQLLAPENLEFLITYTLVGGVFAGLIFVTSAISIPMILDREVDAVSAGLPFRVLAVRHRAGEVDAGHQGKAAHHGRLACNGQAILVVDGRVVHPHRHVAAGGQLRFVELRELAAIARFGLGDQEGLEHGSSPKGWGSSGPTRATAAP